MAKIKYIKDKKDIIIYPVTSTSAVVDNDDHSLAEKLSSMDTAISGKEEAIEDLATIRANANLGSTAYQKPSTGIPQSDLESSIRTILAGVVLYGDEVATVN